MNDIQITNILKDAKNLMSIILDPLAQKVLEIDLKVESAQNKELLSRLIRGLEQYINKGASIAYIGFLGHYSSGKSSTINSLLGSCNTADERETGLNPTDRAITLITHKKNSNALILMNRENGLVPIRTNFIDNNFLEELILADTPGSGDPQIVNEMIQDFLPICDYIFYFISSANPLDQADLPLLQQKTQKLPFIPIHFIITRADEFRLNKNAPLKDENIDQAKKDIFIGKLISRIKQILSSEEINLESFIFIDNESNYNTEFLKMKLINATSSLDQHELIKMHGHKVEFYRSNLHSIYTYYISSINEKIRQSTGFLKTASDNISRFDKSVEMNNEKLKLLWTKNETALKDTLATESNLINEITSNNFSQQLLNDKQIQNEQKMLDKIIEDQANGYLGKITLDLNNHFKQRLKEIKQTIFENISANELLIEHISHLFPGRLDFDLQSQLFEIDFARMNDSTKSYSTKVSSILNDVKVGLKNKTHQVRTIIPKELIINSIKEIYEAGETAIYYNFDQYFERIQMYRSTVLTRNTKETIEKLRIGTQLDELDDDFEDDFISEMKKNAFQEVYFANGEAIDNLQNNANSCLSKVTEIRGHIDAIDISSVGAADELLKENMDFSLLVNDLIRQKETVINSIYQDTLLKVTEHHTSIYNDYKGNLDKIKKKRKKSMTKWAIIVGLICAFVYASLIFSKVIAPQDVTSQILLGLTVTIIGNVAGLVLVKFKTDIKAITSLSKDNFKKRAQSELLQFFNESFWEDLSKKMTDEKAQGKSLFIKEELTKRIKPLIDATNNRGQILLDDLLKANISLCNEINTYKTKLTAFYGKFSAIFLNAEMNLEKIGTITKKIREVSLKPSFDLLEETTSNLQDVKLKIENLKKA